MTSTVRRKEIDIRGGFTLSRVKSYLHTRNNLVEYNEIYDVMQILGDGNGIYVRFTGPGNIIRRNYVHHVLAPGANAGIRCDDSQMDTEIYENVIYKCTKSGITIKGSNTIHNNLLVDILTTDHPDNIHQVPFWGYFGLSPNTRLGDKAEGAVFTRNIMYFSGIQANIWLDRQKELENCTIDKNLYYFAGDPNASQQVLAELQQRGLEENGLAVDPGFVDIAKENFELSPDSPALTQMGFVPLDIAKVGPKGWDGK
jgi:hypothetical protein